MKKSLLIVIAMTLLAGCTGSSDPSEWSSRQIDLWFEKGEWLGEWKVSPDSSIDRRAFAVSWFGNSERWEKAFAFLRENDPDMLELKRYDIDGDNLFATVSEYMTKNEEDTFYEAHRKYIDIQFVASGRELIGITPLSEKKETLEAYDDSKDIEFFTVSKGENHRALPDRFFILFPNDAHRPGLKDGENSPVRKIVVKVKVD